MESLQQILLSPYVLPGAAAIAHTCPNAASQSLTERPGLRFPARRIGISAGDIRGLGIGFVGSGHVRPSFGFDPLTGKAP